MERGINMNKINSDLKIFEVGEMFCVLTYTPNKAIEICVNDDLIDEEDVDEYTIEECDYKRHTWQPIETMKNIFTVDELLEIEDCLKNHKETCVKERDGVKYFFQDCRNEFDYIAVRLSYEQILNTPEILSEFEINSIISTTEY